MAKWEYLIEGLPSCQGSNIGIVKPSLPQDNVMAHLNLRGSEGWELTEFAWRGSAGCDFNSPGLLFVFKRPKP